MGYYQLEASATCKGRLLSTTLFLKVEFILTEHNVVVSANKYPYYIKPYSLAEGLFCGRGKRNVLRACGTCRLPGQPFLESRLENICRGAVFDVKSLHPNLLMSVDGCT